jgi:hypothetical protein
MVPDKETVEAIFRVVQELNDTQIDYKATRVDTDRPFIVRFFLVSLGSALGAYACLIGALALFSSWLNQPELAYIAGVLVFLIYLVIYGRYLLGQLRHQDRNWPAAVFFDRVTQYAKIDVSHVNAFSQYDVSALQYVLVELKAERAAWERRIGLFVGAAEKVGLVPGLVASVAALSRLPNVSPVWLVIIAIVNLMLFGVGGQQHGLLMRLDRSIMLLELVIDTALGPKEDADPSLPE